MFEEGKLWNGTKGESIILKKRASFTFYFFCHGLDSRSSLTDLYVCERDYYCRICLITYGTLSAQDGRNRLEREGPALEKKKKK
jgi:hypothetical protein